MKVKGILIMLFSVALFYVAFFILAPFVTGILPDNEWNKILSLIIYGIIAWFGGIILPVIMFFSGLFIALAGS